MDLGDRWDNINVLSNSDGDLEIKNNVDNEGDRRKVEIKSYIPKRSREKILKPLYIISGVIVLVLIIIIIIAVSLEKSDTNNEYNVNKRLPLGLILHTDDRFWLYNKKSQELDFLFKINHTVSSFDFFDRKKIITIEANTSKIVSLLSDNINETNHDFDFVFKNVKMKAKSLAIDFLTGNTYIIDDELKMLIVINFQSKYYNILLSYLLNPREIVLDPAQGLMFINQESDSILRGNMDGTALTNIIQDSGMTAITLDRKAKRIYWVQDFISIESSDYDGKDRKQFFVDSVDIASLAIVDNSFFWLWPKYGHVNATLWSCKLNNDTCEEHAMHKFNSFQNVKYIKASIDHSDEISNLCKVNNGGCQHLCLVIPNGGRNCVCKLGWQLNPDRKTCRQVTDFILYAEDNYIRGRNTDKTKSSLVDVFWPTAYNVESVNLKGIIDFDYNVNNDEFYFSDDGHIYQMKLKTLSNQIVLLNSDMYEIIEDLAYDWFTGNLYYSLRSKVHSRRHYLMMFNVNQGSEYKKIISYFIYDGTFGLQACPFALAVYPSKGFLFFTAGEDSQRSIQRLTTNGTKLSQIFHIPYIHDHRLITIDYDKDKVYWIHHTEDYTKIKYADFDGSNEKIFTVDSMKLARAISVYHQWLYMSNDTGIYRVHKETGIGLVRIVPEFDNDQRNKKISGMRVFSAAMQLSTADDNPCAVNNGGCKRFCFAAPTKSCD